MFGTCLGHFWDMFTACSGHVQDMFKAWSGHVWDMFRTCLDVWDMFETCLGRVWGEFGASVGRLWGNVGRVWGNKFSFLMLKYTMYWEFQKQSRMKFGNTQHYYCRTFFSSSLQRTILSEYCLTIFQEGMKSMESMIRTKIIRRTKSIRSIH